MDPDDSAPPFQPRDVVWTDFTQSNHYTKHIVAYCEAREPGENGQTRWKVYVTGGVRRSPNPHNRGYSNGLDSGWFVKDPPNGSE